MSLTMETVHLLDVDIRGFLLLCSMSHCMESGLDSFEFNVGTHVTISSP